MRPIACLFVGLVIAACGPARQAPVSAPSPAGEAATRAGGSIEITIPMAIGEFGYVRRQDFDDPSMGSMVRYRNADGLEADVFVYPGPDFATQCPERCARSALESETNGFTRLMRDRPEISRFRVLSARDLVPGAAERWRMGHHLHATVAHESRDRVLQHTDYWIVYFPGFRLKVRSTFVETPERVAALERFLSQVVGAYTAGESPARTSSIPGHPAGLYRAITRR